MSDGVDFCAVADCDFVWNCIGDGSFGMLERLGYYCVLLYTVRRSWRRYGL